MVSYASGSMGLMEDRSDSRWARLLPKEGAVAGFATMLTDKPSEGERLTCSVRGG